MVDDDKLISKKHFFCFIIVVIIGHLPNYSLSVHQFSNSTHHSINLQFNGKIVQVLSINNNTCCMPVSCTYNSTVFRLHTRTFIFFQSFSAQLPARARLAFPICMRLHLLNASSCEFPSFLGKYERLAMQNTSISYCFSSCNSAQRAASKNQLIRENIPSHLPTTIELCEQKKGSE